MSQRYKGAVISATPPTVSATSPNAYGTAKGVWTLQQQMQYEGAGTWPNPFTPVYIEDVFQTWLYTGNGSSQTITNNIDLAGKGGLVWIKNRQTTIGVPIGHILTDTARGATKFLRSQSTSAQETSASSITAFNSSGFSFGSDSNINYSGDTYASWTFRKAEKFFDVVTYTGNGSYPRNISHNLGSAPGCIIVKCTSNSSTDWFVYHRSLSVDGTYGPYRILLNTTAAQSVNDDWKNAPTSTQFTVNNSDTNNNGATYVAYLFAHNAGGFGDAGSDNVITCGSYTGTGSAQTLSLGYEPQWVLIKQSSGANDWNIWDNMRGLVVGGTDAYLQPNTSNAENSLGAYDFLSPTATGLTIDPTSAGLNYVNTNGATYIYIAIRRGPMKTPTTGTSVFGDTYASAEPGYTNLTTESGVLADLVVHGLRINGSSFGRHWMSRLTGNGRYLVSSSDNAEAFESTFWKFDNNNYAYIPASGYANNTVTNTPYVAYSFKRAPGFFDVVCYTGTGSARTVTHNLGAVPEFIIWKQRNTTRSWVCYISPIGVNDGLYLERNQATAALGGVWNSTAPTASVFSLGTSVFGNESGGTYVAYLFASVSGVSKVGSYTGTGALQTVNCGFTTGARFVLIKRTDSTGDWWVYDSARGISSGNDPYLFLNDTAAEVTGTNYVDTTSVGFQVTAAAPAGLNANGGTYIFLAIA